MVAATALLLASAWAPAFAPTDAAGLAALLAPLNGGQAVVALADGRTVVLKEGASTIEETSAAMKASHVRFLPGSVAIGYSEILPDAAILSIARLRANDPARKGKPVPIPSSALAGGRITFTSERGSSVNVASLKDLPWSQPLVLSRAFSNELAGLELGISVKDLDQAEFLRSVAKAIGARFRTDGKNFFLEASGGELRARALKTIELAIQSPRTDATNQGPGTAPRLSEGENGEVAVTYERVPDEGSRRGGRGSRGGIATRPATLVAQLELARAVTSAIPPREFERYLETGEALTLDLAGSQSVQSALIRLLRANATEAPDVARVNRLLATVPPRNPGSVVLGPGFTLEASLNTVDGRGNAGRTIRLRAL